MNFINFLSLLFFGGGLENFEEAIELME